MKNSDSPAMVSHRQGRSSNGDGADRTDDARYIHELGVRSLAKVRDRLPPWDAMAVLSN
jgi:hypothetical protein